MPTPPPEAPSARRWLFGRAVFDESALELRIDGNVIPLQRKPLSVLQHLLFHAGEVVTKDELIRSVWPGRIVSETVLAKAVGKLREAIEDGAQDLIKTVHGYGYRFTGKVDVVQKRGPVAARLAYGPGDHPPGRPLWSLVRRLGTGGQGEAWLAAHDKTREKRVFKFALDHSSLAALKREITLFRFLNDSIGSDAPIVTLRDWNLEEPPYFIEATYVAGGNLSEWAENNGGLTAMPLAARLHIAAQLASALAAIHSLGVLHKDIKPTNVLIDTSGAGSPRALLADFGVGGLLNAERVDSLGITRMGFTKTAAALSGGTPLYAAPEVLAGQPPTVKADIYALGVLIYQLVVGEFRRPLSAGWERNVGDELLRECIALAVQGDPVHRAGDAGQLADRLLNLERDRASRANQVEAQRQAKQLADALAAAKNSQAVADFLSKDMFSVVSSRPLRDLTVLELLRSASERLADRFDALPVAAAQIHSAMGNAFWKMECLEDSRTHYDKALGHLERVGLHGTEAGLPIVGQLVLLDAMLGRPAELERYSEVLDKACVLLGNTHRSVLGLRQQIAWARFGYGHWAKAARELEAVLGHASTIADEELLANVPLQLGRAHAALGNYGQALKTLRDAHERLKAHGSSGDQLRAHIDGLIAAALIRLGDTAAADAALDASEKKLSGWPPHEKAVQLTSYTYLRAQLALARSEAKKAVPLFEKALNAFSEVPWVHKSGLLGEVLTWLALAHLADGCFSKAEAAAARAIEISLAIYGPAHPQTLAARIAAAEIGITSNELTAASSTLRLVDEHMPAPPDVPAPIVTDLLRVRGLLLHRQGHEKQARLAFRRALQNSESILGADHPATKRLLALATPRSPA